MPNSFEILLFPFRGTIIISMSQTRYEVEQQKQQMPELMYVSYSKYERDWASVMHSHSTAEIIYVTGGNGTLKMRSGNFSLSDGDFVMIPPHIMHTETSSSETPLEYYVLGVANITVMMREEKSFSPILDLGSSRDEAKGYITQIYREMQEKREGYQMMMKSLLLHLTVMMMRRKKLELGFEESLNLKTDLANVKSYIDSHYANAITLDELAEIAIMSKFHLVREFTKALGTSPIEYLLERRIGEARILLSSTSMSISDIASSIGFSSASYFSQRFKLVTGTTPIEFRNSTRLMRGK